MIYSFKFYRTFVPQLPKNTPITLGVEHITASNLRRVEGYEHVFLHSGNWWNIPESARTPSKIYSAYLKLSKVCNVEGVMSTNIPPSRRDTKYRIWTYPKEVRREALEKSLRYALELKELMGDKADIIYCSFEVGTYEDAYEYTRRAYEYGFRRFGIGAAGFLMGSGTMFEPYKQLIDVVVAMRSAIEPKDYVHVSGVGSLKLIPILYYLGVNSCDGSTPIRAALSMGIVYDVEGNQYRVRELNEWRCDCPVCSRYDPRSAAELLKRDYSARVLHNSYIWDKVIERVEIANRESMLEKFLESYLSRSRLLFKVFLYAKHVKSKYLEKR